jgi:hypothetical protein
MPNAVLHHSHSIVLYAVLAALASAVPATAQSVSGQAKAVQTSIVDPLGGITTTVLADTGALSGSTDAREASASAGSVTSVLSGGTLHATTIGWPDQVKSEASVGELSIAVGATAVAADFVMARASAVQGFAGYAAVSISGLTINGLPITVTGTPNQTITIPGGRVVIHERPAGSMGTVVNALHVIVTSVADVIVASATARVQ